MGISKNSNNRIRHCERSEATILTIRQLAESNPNNLVPYVRSPLRQLADRDDEMSF